MNLPTADMFHLLEAIERDYGLGVCRIDRAVKRVTGGLFKIAIEGRDSVWLRIGSVANRTESEFETEGACAKGLAGLGMPLTAPITTVTGRFAITIAWAGRRQPAILYEEAKGTTVTEPTAMEMTAFGQALGLLHGEKATSHPLPADPLADWGSDWCEDRAYWQAHLSQLRGFV